MTTTVNVLGTGTPTPTKERHGSAFAIRIGDETLMVDCGPGTTGKLVKAGLWPTDVDTVFLTHHHFDHNVDLPCFLLTRWDQAAGKGNELHVYGPQPTSAFVEKLIGANGAFAPDLDARTNAVTSLNVYRNRGGEPPRLWPSVRTTDIGAGWRRETPNWTMSAFHAQHVQPYLDCLAYRLETPDGVLVFSGDTEPCDSVREAAAGADLFFCMAWDNDEDMARCGEHIGQTGVQGAAGLAAAAGVGRLVLVHTGPAISESDAQEKAVASAKESFAGDVVFAAELMTLEL